jgi:hypothetical protein
LTGPLPWPRSRTGGQFRIAFEQNPDGSPRHGPRYRYFGNGVHDLVPHGHRVSPWGGVRSYSFTPLGPTQSYNGFPGYYGGHYGRPFGWGY